MYGDLDYLLTEWKQATSELKWGVNKAFRTVFEAAADGGTTLVYGADYRDKYPCLVNTVGSMLSVGGGHGVPSTHFARVVNLFDSINRELESRQVNTRPGYVSPVAADVFLHHFGDVEAPADYDLKLAVNDATQVEAFAEGIYREPTDEEIAADMAKAFIEPSAPCDVAIDEDDPRKWSTEPIEARQNR